MASAAPDVQHKGTRARRSPLPVSRRIGAMLSAIYLMMVLLLICFLR